MSNPRDAFRCAERKRDRPEPDNVAGLTDSAVSGSAPAKPEEERPERIMVPQPIRENSVYRQLMRSHDRMHTRHIKG